MMHYNNSAPSTIKTGVEYLLTEVIGYKTDVTLMAGRIRSYAIPSKKSDVCSWLVYVINNIDHLARRILHWAAPSYINQSEWSKLEDNIYQHFSSVVTSKDVTNVSIHWSELPQVLASTATRNELNEEYSKKFRIYIYLLALDRTKKALTTCLEAQTNGLSYEHAVQISGDHHYSHIAMTDFKNEIPKYRTTFLTTVQNR